MEYEEREVFEGTFEEEIFLNEIFSKKSFFGGFIMIFIYYHTVTSTYQNFHSYIFRPLFSTNNDVWSSFSNLWLKHPKL